MKIIELVVITFLALGLIGCQGIRDAQMKSMGRCTLADFKETDVSKNLYNYSEIREFKNTEIEQLFATVKEKYSADKTEYEFDDENYTITSQYNAFQLLRTFTYVEESNITKVEFSAQHSCTAGNNTFVEIGEFIFEEIDELWAKKRADLDS